MFLDKNRKLQVFLSYAREDSSCVNRIVRYLYEYNVDIWFDQEKLIGGQNWKLEIRKAIRKSDIVVVFLSSHSVTHRGFIQKEMRLALDEADMRPEGEIYIIPVRLEKCDIPINFQEIHAIDYFSDEQKGLQDLLNALDFKAQALTETVRPRKKSIRSTSVQPFHSDSRRFIKLEPSQLHRNAIAPEALDNQWVSRKMLREMLRRGKKLSDMTDERELAVVNEWRRALVYTPQIVLNRAYLYNNHIIARDYVSADARNAFIELLNQQVIVIALFTEENPAEKPAFYINPEFWSAWLKVVENAQIACVRTSWDDPLQEIRNLVAPFHSYIQNLNMPNRIRYLMDAFHVPEEQRDAFRKRIIELADEAFEVANLGRTITRNHIYRKFVCVDGTNAAEGIYDRDKPFSAEIKQIVDSRYNAIIPDVYGCYSWSPNVSPPRAALGNMQEVIREIIEDEELIGLIASLRDMEIPMFLEAPHFIEELHYLILDDVLQIRAFDEWQIYNKRVDQLLGQPTEVSLLCQNVFESFVRLNQEITKLKDGYPTAPWRPMMQFALTIGGKTLWIAPNPEQPTEKLLFEEAGLVEPGNEPLLLRMVISESNNYGADLDIGLNLLRGIVRSGRDAWNEIFGMLASTHEIRVVGH